MRNWIFVFGVLGCFFCSALPAESRGMGRFLGSMVARGAASAAVHSGTSSSSSASTSATKTYSSDTLTVAQLAQCLKGAANLDETSERLELDRKAVQSSFSEVSQSKAALDQKESSLNQRSKAAVKAFNASVERHNALVTGANLKQTDFNAAVDAHNIEVKSHNNDCARKYYDSDLADAKKLAGITIE
jgi:hypothetical protein